MRRFGFLGAALAVTAALLMTGCSSDSDDKAKKGDDAAAAEGSSDGDTSSTSTSTSEPARSGAGAGAYVEALAASMRADGEMPLDDAQIECFSERYVDVVGVDRFEAAGISPEQLADDEEGLFNDVGLTEAEGNDLYDAFGDCDIDLRRLTLEAAALEEEMSPDAQKCLEEVLSEANFRTFIVGSMIHGDDAMEADPEVAEVLSGLMACAFMDIAETDE